MRGACCLGDRRQGERMKFIFSAREAILFCESEAPLIKFGGQELDKKRDVQEWCVRVGREAN